MLYSSAKIGKCECVDHCFVNNRYQDLCLATPNSLCPENFVITYLFEVKCHAVLSLGPESDIFFWNYPDSFNGGSHFSNRSSPAV